MKSDASVVATFQIDPDSLQPLADQACAALGVPDVSSISRSIIRTKPLSSIPTGAESDSVKSRLLEALEINQLGALNVVGWETNERFSVPFHYKNFLLLIYLDNLSYNNTLHV